MLENVKITRLGGEMDIKNFKSGEYRQEYKYKSFIPSNINHTFTWDNPEINVMLENATRVLGKLDAFTSIVPNIDIFIKMHVTKEAISSSKIEGTKTEIDEVLISEEQILPEKRDDWQEVQNYIKAMNFAIEELDTLPLSNRLLKNVHKILLNSVRGERKQPGEFRKSQNWIGGVSLRTAYFIPPHHNKVVELMSDLELFLHNENIFVPHLIKIAIAHYQFETIHPFLDGNGRIGRLLITLYLVSNGLLQNPSLYLSDFIEKHKMAYYETLTFARINNDLTAWIKFFLEAIIVTAENGIKTFENILKLKKKSDLVVLNLGKKVKNGNKLLEHLYQNPIITLNNVVKILGVTKPTASSLVKDFMHNDILKEVTGYGRNKLFVFDEYLKIFM